MTEAMERSVEDLDEGRVVVRALAFGDLDAIVRIDASASGKARREYYRDRVVASLSDSRIRTSLVAEVDGMVVGFLMSTTHYGEFGRMEPTSEIDSIGVYTGFQRRHIASAMMRQFLMNARALGVSRL